jgi:hypothetical protein
VATTAAASLVAILCAAAIVVFFIVFVVFLIAIVVVVYELELELDGHGCVFVGIVSTDTGNWIGFGEHFSVHTGFFSRWNRRHQTGGSVEHGA